jgi:hypothetical protein
MPDFDEERINEAYEKLSKDLMRIGGDDWEFKRNYEIDIAGVGRVEIPLVVKKNDQKFYSLCNPLTEGKFFDKKLEEVNNLTTTEIYPIDELMVKMSLPQASNIIRSHF